MHNRVLKHIRDVLLPCLGFSVAVGFISAILVTAFKLAAEAVIHLSGSLYGAVRVNPVWVAVLVLGAAAIGLAASFIHSVSRSCRGGGIPTAVAAIRGIVNFNWVRTIFLLPFSALLTFFCGLPLGTEGPCVQMGTAIGDGVVKCLAPKKYKGWRRYIMTGGASAGFSIATSSPITAILFSMEELNKHFSPLVLTIAAISVMSAQITVQILASFGIGSGGLFHISELVAIPTKQLFVPLIVGIVCGGCSILFTRLYHFIDSLMHRVVKKLSVRIVFPILFAAVSVIGFFLPTTLGSGHSLVETIFDGNIAWYLLILIFLIRAAVMMVSNTSGVTGGVFLPTLAFGGLIGSFSAKVLIMLGWIESDLYILVVVLGITAFLGATSRIPVTACVFAIEALGGINNVIAIMIATVAAFLVVELSGLEDFTDTILEAKTRSIHKGKKPMVIETSLTVKEGSLAVGKEFRDILWPNSCVVISFERAEKNHGRVGLAEDDVITVHYKTYDPAETAEEFRLLVGEQSERIDRIMHPEEDIVTV